MKFTANIPMAINNGEPVEITLQHKVVVPGKKALHRGDKVSHCTFWRVLYKKRWRTVYTGTPMFFLCDGERIAVEKHTSDDYLIRYVFNQMNNINEQYGWHY